jgi:hypothetical protein
MKLLGRRAECEALDEDLRSRLAGLRWEPTCELRRSPHLPAS